MIGCRLRGTAKWRAEWPHELVCSRETDLSSKKRMAVDRDIARVLLIESVHPSDCAGTDSFGRQRRRQRTEE